MTENIKAGTSPAQKTPEGKKVNAKTAGAVVTLRNQGLYGVYRKLITLTLLTGAVAVFGVVVAIYSNAKKVPPQYIPITEKNEILSPVPLDKPNKSPASILEFALKAVKAINTYDYINYRDQLQNAGIYFTPNGWADYTGKFQTQGTLKLVTERQAIVSVDIQGELKIKRTGSVTVGTQQVYVWVVTLPVSIHYIFHLASSQREQGNQNIDQTGTVTLYLLRLSSVESPNGVGVEAYQMTVDK